MAVFWSSSGRRKATSCQKRPRVIFDEMSPCGTLRHFSLSAGCLVLGAKQTRLKHFRTIANDPKPTSSRAPDPAAKAAQN